MKKAQTIMLIMISFIVNKTTICNAVVLLYANVTIYPKIITTIRRKGQIFTVCFFESNLRFRKTVLL